MKAKKETNRSNREIQDTKCAGSGPAHADCRYSACKNNGRTVWHDAGGGVSGLFAKVFIVSGACTKAL
mgnify:CR=1 FL=1